MDDFTGQSDIGCFIMVSHHLFAMDRASLGLGTVNVAKISPISAVVDEIVSRKLKIAILLPFA